MFGLSDYLSAKLLLGIGLCIAAAVYGAWRGWHGKPLDQDEDDKP